MKKDSIIPNIICFVISLNLLRFGCSGVKFILQSGILGFENPVVGGIELFGNIISITVLMFSIALLISGIILGIITIKLGRNVKSNEDEEDMSIREISYTTNMGLIYAEIVIYIIWIIMALV